MTIAKNAIDIKFIRKFSNFPKIPQKYEFPTFSPETPKNPHLGTNSPKVRTLMILQGPPLFGPRRLD